MIIFNKFSRFFSLLGEIMAFLTIIMLGLIYLNGVISFLPASFLSTITNIKEYAVIITLTLCGFAFASRRSILIFIPFCILAVCALACYSIVIFK